ncbi:MAG: CoA transferase [Anaerolineae bacterium]|jgi:crotonobetainyl-CoA:carnitine CoA-transferase CaiB-like acyl-CoA transferase|nr:CoA transferase [Anaerolineae bacterium]
MWALSGVRVLDLTRLLPGAIATLLLADLGAEVIKIEDPAGGDYARWMPPLLAGTGAFFRASNRNKHSVILNLKDERGQAVLQRLVHSADVLVEGFRPGVAARLKCDYATLSAHNPRLIYVSLSGWGQTGPYAQRSGHDLNYVALNGLPGSMGTPQPPGGQIADVSGAYASVMGISAALYQREKTGTGAYLDVALAEAALPFVMYQWVESLLTGLPGGQGSLTGGMACYAVYFSADEQPLALAPIEPKFWHNFCAAVQRPDWLPLHQDLAAQARLKAEIQALFATHTAAEWDARLGGADCCFTRIVPPARVADDPQVQARGLAGVGDDGVPWLRSPVHLGPDKPPLIPAPQPGEHTRQVLAGLGYSPAALDALAAAGVIR